MSTLDCFKAYDVRGAVPDVLSPQLVRAAGRAFVAETGARHAVIGRDARLSGPLLRDALCLGLRESGCEVTDIGMCGTEEIYYAAFAQPFDGGIMITGSHNPAHENGLKMVRAGAVPISGDSGLHAIRDRTAEELRTLTADTPPAGELAPLHTATYRTDYVAHLLSMVGTDGLRPLKIHCDAGNGCAGPVLRALAPHLPCELILLHEEPDGTFPHGIPNPLLPEKREFTAKAVREHRADFGLAWDGDFDRCFFYDAEGRSFDSYMAAREAYVRNSDDINATLLYIRTASGVLNNEQFLNALYRAQKKFPNNSEIMLGLARTYKIIGDKPNAKYFYNAFLNGTPKEHPLYDEVNEEFEEYVSGDSK